MDVTSPHLQHTHTRRMERKVARNPDTQSATTGQADPPSEVGKIYTTTREAFNLREVRGCPDSFQRGADFAYGMELVSELEISWICVLLC